MKRRVLAFGTFDPLHKGHEYFLAQAKKLGDHLLVIVARDSYIRAIKKREPKVKEQTRRLKVQALEFVDEATLGEEWPVEDSYQLLAKLAFNVLALGYDQAPDDRAVKQILASIDRGEVEIVRLKAYQPRRYKSSLIKDED